eukprot:TRINITY_DN4117_c0_g1_i2.p1 TRINITY_DN4117_c0_g1~~TRINITY_DN4117_c0_g1_i2.p1  ORF type:complete len:120 (+),score=23.47 TRINITY_DN4117_c0_g1_i2:115-474(+)
MISLFELSKFCSIFGRLERDLIEKMELTKKLDFRISHISTPQANLFLKNKKPESFLFRFSKTNPNLLVLSFIDSSSKINHCLFKFSQFLEYKSNFLKCFGLEKVNNVNISNSYIDTTVV